MIDATKKTMWELLWDFDPNGLLVVDTDLTVIDGIIANDI